MRDRFTDRSAAGKALGAELARVDWSDPVVLALPRGGVPVAVEVADALDAPLDVVVARKIGAPRQPELAVGAVTADGATFYDDETLAALGLDRERVSRQRADALDEAKRRQQRYGSPHPPEITGRDVIVVDDGLATGLTAHAAVHAVRMRDPRTVTVAVPVGSPAAVRRLGATADAVVCLAQPPMFRAVGQWYRDFRQVSDEQVDRIVAAHAQ